MKFDNMELVLSSGVLRKCRMIFLILFFSVKVNGNTTLRLTPSVVVKGEPFSLVCTAIQTFAIFLKYNGTNNTFQQIATVVWGNNSCHTFQDSINNYTFNCSNNGFSFILNVPVDQVQREDNTCWKCQGSVDGSNQVSNAVHVLYRVPVESVHLMDKILILNEGQLLVLVCETYPCRPSADIYWMYEGRNITDFPVNVTTKRKGDELYVTKGTLIYKGRKQDDGKQFSCRAYNGFGTSQTSENLTITIYYPPEIFFIISPYNVIENQTMNITCLAKSNPDPNHISWCPEGEDPGTSRLYYKYVSRTNKGNYTCTAKNNLKPYQGHQQIGSDTMQIEVNVLYPPEINHLTSVYKVIENETINITCEASANPDPHDIFWSPVGEGSVTSLLYFKTVPRNRKGSYTCTAKNIMQPSKGQHQNGSFTKQIEIDILYPPFVVSMKTPIELTEGESLDLMCTSDGNPRPNLIWNPRGDETDNTSRLFFRSLNRNHNGTYKCTANNIMIPTNGSALEGSDSKTVSLNILYPPDIIIMATNVTVHDKMVTLVCLPDGFPDKYRFGEWKHYWPGVNIALKSLPSTTTDKAATLELHNITYEDSGIYTCHASNGIKALGSGMDVIAESVYLLVKSAPVILGTLKNFNVNIGQYVLIQFDLYSNTDENLTFTAAHVNSSDIIYQGILQSILLDSLPVKSFTVSSPGYRARLNINITTEKDFGQYSIVVGNIIGSDVRSIEIMAENTYINRSKEDSNGAVLAGGICAGVLVIIITAVVLVILKRRSYSRKETKSLADNPVYDSSDLTPSSATNTNVIAASYPESVEPKMKDINMKNTSSVYAQVTMINKKRKKSNTYENETLTGRKGNSKNIYELGDNVLESPAAARKFVQVPKDGFVYADLKLDAPTIKNGKPVIIGLEQRTLYAEIAYGKRGEQGRNFDDEHTNSV